MQILIVDLTEEWSTLEETKLYMQSFLLFYVVWIIVGSFFNSAKLI